MREEATGASERKRDKDCLEWETHFKGFPKNSPRNLRWNQLIKRHTAINNATRGNNMKDLFYLHIERKRERKQWECVYAQFCTVVNTIVTWLCFESLEHSVKRKEVFLVYDGVVLMVCSINVARNGKGKQHAFIKPGTRGTSTFDTCLLSFLLYIL